MKARDARDHEIRASRLTRLNQTVKPWLEKIAEQKGTFQHNSCDPKLFED